jgi:hypothetical protein
VKRLSTLLAVMVCLALLAGCTMAIDPNFQPQAGAQPQINNPQIAPEAAHWQTWVLASSDELRPPPPPDAAASAAELAELQGMVAAAAADDRALVAYWDAGSPAYRWVDIALDQYRPGPPGPRVSRGLALVNIALYDAIIATWEAKYTYNRPHPSGITSLVATPASPSYPSEHAAAAGAAATVLAYLFPDRADLFAAQAEEAAHSRLIAGVHYPSDVEAGLALGRAVGEAVIDWAMADGSDAVWAGEIPTGPGMWVGDNPVAPLAGTWKTWVLTSGDQFLPPPPPAYDSEQIQTELMELKTYTRTVPVMAHAFYWNTFESAYPSWYSWANQRIFEQRLDHSAPHTVRLYVAMAVANHDAIVACFGAKYAYWFIRPSQLDPELVTLFPPPPHPSYPAAHGCGSGAFGAVLGGFFPAEAETIKHTAADAASSRIEGGIHYRVDVEAGLTLGEAVAQAVLERVQEMAPLE